MSRVPRSKSDNIASLNYNDRQLTDPAEITECFNMHFSEIGLKLASKQKETTKSYFDYLNQAQTGFESSEFNLKEVLH